MQLIQPKVKELQKKYGHDKEKLAQETMKLYKESGTNPFASCLPILLQMPIFFALFGVLNNAADGNAKGVLTESDAEAFGDSELWGVPLSGSLFNAGGDVGHHGDGGAPRGRDDRDHVPHPAAADEQEHAGRRAHRPLRPAAEAPALRAARGLRRRRHRLPDRRPPLLDHLQPVDDGPAVLRDPQQPGAGHARGRGQAGARRGQGRPPRRRRRAGDRHDHGRGARDRAASRPAAAAQAQTRQQRKKKK